MIYTFGAPRVSSGCISLMHAVSAWPTATVVKGAGVDSFIGLDLEVILASHHVHSRPNPTFVLLWYESFLLVSHRVCSRFRMDPVSWYTALFWPHFNLPNESFRISIGVLLYLVDPCECRIISDVYILDWWYNLIRYLTNLVCNMNLNCLWLDLTFLWLRKA